MLTQLNMDTGCCRDWRPLGSWCRCALSREIWAYCHAHLVSTLAPLSASASVCFIHVNIYLTASFACTCRCDREDIDDSLPEIVVQVLAHGVLSVTVPKKQYNVFVCLSGFPQTVPPIGRHTDLLGCYASASCCFPRPRWGTCHQRYTIRLVAFGSEVSVQSVGGFVVLGATRRRSTL